MLYCAMYLESGVFIAGFYKTIRDITVCRKKYYFITLLINIYFFVVLKFTLLYCTDDIFTKQIVGPKDVNVIDDINGMQYTRGM